MKPVSILEWVEAKSAFLSNPEETMAKLQNMREKIGKTKWLQDFLSSSQIFCEVIEITLRNGINIDLSLAGNGNWVFQVFSDDPLKPQLPMEKSVKISVMLNNLLLREESGFILQAPKHGVHDFPHYEKEIPEQEIATNIALVWKIAA